VRRTDARRRERDRCEGVTQGFQVSAYKVDPRVCVLARNLLAKKDWSAALLLAAPFSVRTDEVVEVRPEVPLVSKPSAFACRAERLARTGTGPNRSVIWPSGGTKRKRPATDAGKEVALDESLQVGGVNIFDTPGVYLARRNQACSD
jgi:hypothetical protein